MKFLISLIIPSFFLFLTTGLQAQIKDAKVEKVKIYGNCSICKATIEKTGSKPSISEVVWDHNTKIAVITYNPSLISLDTILKDIAKSGYTNEKYKAKKSDYDKLPPCCQY